MWNKNTFSIDRHKDTFHMLWISEAIYKSCQAIQVYHQNTPRIKQQRLWVWTSKYSVSLCNSGSLQASVDWIYEKTLVKSKMKICWRNLRFKKIYTWVLLSVMETLLCCLGWGWKLGVGTYLSVLKFHTRSITVPSVSEKMQQPSRFELRSAEKFMRDWPYEWFSIGKSFLSLIKYIV